MTEQNRVAHALGMKSRTADVSIHENIDFSGLYLSDFVLKGLKSSGFVRPSPIQLKAIPVGRCGLDLIVQAKSGTGKTCVFSVIALESLALESNSTQVLVLAPTREIALQIQEVLTSIGSAMKGLLCHTFIGGTPLNEDRQKLRKCHIAVGSPGRIKQLIEEKIMKTESIRMFILDEADKLLEDSFQEQINWIYSMLPENKQMLALSATYPEYLAQHLTKYMRNPTFMRLNANDPALLGIKQYFQTVIYHPLPQKVFEEKLKWLVKMFSSVDFHQCLLFSNLQTRAQTLCDILNSKGWPSTCISGSQDQQSRIEAMDKLKKFQCRVLISTDLTSRGIDAERVNLVINLDLPRDHETYLHRIGRAGRYGSYGVSVTFVSEGGEVEQMRAIERKCGTHIDALPDPLPTDLAKNTRYLGMNDLITSEQIITRPENTASEGGHQRDKTIHHKTSHTRPQNGSHCGKLELALSNTKCLENGEGLCNGVNSRTDNEASHQQDREVQELKVKKDVSASDQEPVSDSLSEERTFDQNNSTQLQISTRPSNSMLSANDPQYSLGEKQQLVSKILSNLQFRKKSGKVRFSYKDLLESRRASEKQDTNFCILPNKTNDGKKGTEDLDSPFSRGEDSVDVSNNQPNKDSLASQIGLLLEKIHLEQHQRSSHYRNMDQVNLVDHQEQHQQQQDQCMNSVKDKKKEELENPCMNSDKDMTKELQNQCTNSDKDMTKEVHRPTEMTRLKNTPSSFGINSPEADKLNESRRTKCSTEALSYDFQLFSNNEVIKTHPDRSLNENVGSTCRGKQLQGTRKSFEEECVLDLDKEAYTATVQQDDQPRGKESFSDSSETDTSESGSGSSRESSAEDNDSDYDDCGVGGYHDDANYDYDDYGTYHDYNSYVYDEAYQNGRNPNCLRRQECKVDPHDDIASYSRYNEENQHADPMQYYQNRDNVWNSKEYLDKNPYASYYWSSPNDSSKSQGNGYDYEHLNTNQHCDYGENLDVQYPYADQNYYSQNHVGYSSRIGEQSAWTGVMTGEDDPNYDSSMKCGGHYERHPSQCYASHQGYRYGPYATYSTGQQVAMETGAIRSNPGAICWVPCMIPVPCYGYGTDVNSWVKNDKEQIN